jgi:predicted Fe-Mo cluster-binding NifX family protein
MLVAIPIWQGRVSPVLDVAAEFLLVQLDGECVVARRREAVTAAEPDRRAARLAELGVETVICGAVSRPLEMVLTAARIQVVRHVCGDVEEVVEGFQKGRLDDERFVMPGCCGRRRQFRRGRSGRWGCRRDGNTSNP